MDHFNMKQVLSMKNPSPMKKINLLDIFYSQASLKLKLIKSADFCFGSLLCALLRGRESVPAPKILNRVLIIRPGGLGDSIFLLPTLRAFRKQWPAIKIDILCERRNEDVFLSQQDLFRHVWSYDRFTQFFEVWKQKYDIVIDTEQWHYASALIAYFLKSDMKIGYGTRPLRRKLFNKSIVYDSDLYELDNFFRLFDQFIGKERKARDINRSFTVPPKQLQWARHQIPKDCIAFET